MATEHLAYSITQQNDGWHAGPTGSPPARVFASKEEALKWCQAQAQTSSASAAPEEGAYADAEADVEIRES